MPVFQPIGARQHFAGSSRRQGPPCGWLLQGACCRVLTEARVASVRLPFPPACRQCHPSKVGRDTLLLEVPPALEGLAGPRRGRHQGAPDLDSTVFPAAILVEVLLEADQLLAAADDAAHHPVERPTFQQLARPAAACSV